MKIYYIVFFFILCLISFGIGNYYYPFLSDDSLISLRYAQRFLEGKGLTWNDGHPVEGYSNLLWILLVSAFGKLGINLITAARLLGIICSATTLAVLTNYVRNQNTKKECGIFALLLLATTPCFSVWAIGGLEQPLYILLLTLSIIEVSKIVQENKLNRIYFLSIWLGLLALTRPDGFLFTILTSIFLLAVNFKNKKNLAKIFVATAFIPSLFLLGQLIFRYNFYGELVPNTALVKVKITFHHVIRGIYYNFRAFFGTFLLSGLGIISLYYLLFKRQNIFGFYLAMNVVVWVAYVSLVGGDIFPAFRHYYVVIILFVFAIINGLQEFKKIKFNSKKLQVSLVLILVINLFVQTKFNDNFNAKDERWEFVGMNLGEGLKKTFPKNTLIAVTAAGCIPYASELPTIDMLGLNDYFIPRHPPKNFGNGSLAHELGDANYTLGQNPDIIIFSTGSELNFNIGDQLKVNPIFNKNYVRATIKENHVEYLLFFNKYGKNAGVQYEDDDMIKIPAYLLTNASDTISTGLSKGKILKNLEANKMYSINLKAKDGNWKVNLINDKPFEIDSKIINKNGELTVSITPKSKMFLESLEIERIN